MHTRSTLDLKQPCAKTTRKLCLRLEAVLHHDAYQVSEGFGCQRVSVCVQNSITTETTLETKSMLPDRQNICTIKTSLRDRVKKNVKINMPNKKIKIKKITAETHHCIAQGSTSP